MANDNPKTNNWVLIGPMVGFENCGKKATKNISNLGLNKHNVMACFIILYFGKFSTWSDVDSTLFFALNT